jgi:transposase
MAKKYIVTLTPAEREYLQQLTSKGKNPVYKVNHARILLKADTSQDGGGWSDSTIASALDISISTIERVRRRFVEEGIEMALGRHEPKARKPRRMDGEQEAYLIALACSEPPEGKERSPLRMLADYLVEWGEYERVSHETVRQTLKKTKLNPG